MKKSLTLPLLTPAILLFLLLPSFASATVTLRVGHEQNHPIANTGSDGKSEGILVDTLNEVARREGWIIEYEPCLWNQCMDNLEAGRIDLLIGIAYTAERAERFSFNAHTVISNWGILYSNPANKIESYSNLNGKRIALIKNDVYSNTMTKMLHQFDIRCDIVYADNFKSVFNMIDNGLVDVGVVNRFFSLLNEKQYRVKPTSIIFSPVSVQIAATKNRNPEILTLFDRHLEEMKKDRSSVYQCSLQHWLALEGASYSLPRWLWWAFGGVFSVSLLLVIFTALLRREVQRKTSDLRHEVVERRYSEEQLRLVLDNMQEIFIHFSLDGTIIFISNGIEQFGYSPSELKGNNCDRLFNDNYDFHNLIIELTEKEMVSGYRISFLKKDGTERIVSINARLLIDDNGNPSTIIASGTDVTDQVKMGELMAQTEKMMMVGGLAAGMAHEINNPLGIIMQHIQNIERRIDPDLPANRETASALSADLYLIREYIDRRGILKFMHQIHDAGDRMSRIINNMLKFSRKTESHIESANIEKLLEQAIELAASDYDLKKHYDFNSIEIVREYDHTLDRVPVTVLEIEQVLLNLLKNAAQAMASCKKDKPPRIILRTKFEADFAVIDIEDNGPGMNKEVQRRIFEPFFTTKEIGIGTGLGLSVSYIIITNNHHGRFEVRSKPGEGTCFSIWLPMKYQSVMKIQGELK